MSKAENFSYPSSDGKTQIHAVCWKPEQGEIRGILQINHGMIEYIERYEDFASYMNRQGYLVVGNDHVGHGHSVVSEKEFGFFGEVEHPSDILVEDMHTLRKMMQKEYQHLPYFMLAHSMGSYMLRKYLALHGENLSGAIIVGTGSEDDKLMKIGMIICTMMAKVRGWHYRSRFLQKLSYGKPYRKFDLYGKHPENSWLTKDMQIIAKYMENPFCTFRFTINGYFGLMEAVYFDNQIENIEKIPKKLPVFLVSGEDDPVGNLGKGVKKVYDQYEAAGIQDLTCKLYKNDRHEILNETDKDVVYKDIYDWIRIRETT